MTNTLQGTEKSSGSAKIAFDLEGKIVDGSIAGGSRLIERVLCTEYAVSRTVVREALLKLVSRGLVAIVPDAGATVVPLLESQVRDAFVFREAIESAAAEQCAMRMNREETRALVECASRFGEEYDRSARGESSQIYDLEEEFHRAIVEGSKNDFFITSWQPARLCLFRRWHQQPAELRKPEKREVSVDDHAAIAQAIAEGSAEDARRLMSRHLRKGRDFLIEGMRRQR